MREDRDNGGNLLSDGDRLTPLGDFLRRTSLDELPQLWNVLKGEMSLVGPRPLEFRYLPRYTPEQRRRHDVLPGITGWAQVNGRNAIDWGRKFALDVWYVDNRSIWLDIKIIAMTLWRVLSTHGVTEPGYATASEFRGTSTSSRGSSNG
jgi:sugar transferase EpsL